MLELKKIVKDYISSGNVTHALKGVDISFRQNEFVSILGPSGCGKTTTLNIIGGLDRYTSGDLLIKGKSTKHYKDRDWDTYRNHSIGFVFQTYNLIPHLNILGNVELALTIGGVSKEEREARALEALKKVGLENEAKKRPNQLSGGQMQRVAIARALVNNPEILLADEPTGALDSVTSVQIMELLKEVAKDRLVIMVTHNPDLAYKYSTRIVTMKDGEITSDSNPFNESQEKKEEIEKVRKSKMNGKTTFLLSSKNLWSKAKRTALVCIAGSIGIIGISAVLAVTTGVRSYIHDMQDDMLSGNPVKIEESSLDLSSLISFASTAQKKNALERSIEDGKVNIDYMIEYLADTRNKFEDSFSKNDITPEYVQYIKEMPSENYSAMRFTYGNNRKFNIFTDWSYDSKEEGKPKQTKKVKHISLKEIEDIYVSIVKQTKFAPYASMIPMFTSTFDVLPNNEQYVLSQYDILNENGKLPTKSDEMAIVIDKDQQLTDLFLAQVGYYSQSEFAQIISKFANSEEIDPEHKYDGLEPEKFDYSTLINKTFTVYNNDDLFFKNSSFITSPFDDCAFCPIKFGYNGHFKNDGSDLPANGKEMKITAILKPKEKISYGCLKTGFALSGAFDESFIKTNKESEIAKYIQFIQTIYQTKTAEEIDDIEKQIKMKEMALVESPLSPLNVLPEAKKALEEMLKSTTIIQLVYYSFADNFDISSLDFIEDKGSITTFSTPISVGTISKNVQDMSILQNLMGSFDIPSQLESAIRSIGGETTANEISIFPKSFDDKHYVTDWLDDWNGDDPVKIHPDGTEQTISRDDRSNIKYTDNLEIVINLVNALIDVVSIALIAFTSLSLVVSTVMIGIITYVSVVERVKEIGIIRSLGGRKIDVSNLFIVETFIIGAISGLFGLAVTYVLSVIINIIIGAAAGVGAIIWLPWYLAVAVLALSIGLTLISGLIPARVAAKKDPVVALRSGE